MATIHPDAQEFLQWFPPRVLVTSSRCPDCREWAYVDLLAGELVCYRHATVLRWSLRERIDARARRTMEEEPNGATVYHRPRRGRPG